MTTSPSTTFGEPLAGAPGSTLASAACAPVWVNFFDGVADRGHGAVEELVHLVHHAARRGRGRGRLVGLGLFGVGHRVTCAERLALSAPRAPCIPLDA